MTADVMRKPITNIWWLVLLHGIATLVIGLLLVTAPGITTAVLVRFLGFYWLVSGVFSIVSIFGREREVHWIWPLLSGVLGILAGILVIDHPLLSTIIIPTTLVIILAIQGIIMGGFSLIQGFQGDGWGVGLWGVVNIIIGVLLLGRPMIAATALPIVIGVFALIGGITSIVMAFRLRSA